MEDWDDIRYLLAVADTGSTLAAGRLLRVSQTTAARRVAALEARLHLRLFDRRQAGYTLTPDGEALLARARAVREAAEGFADAAASRARAASGTLRLTCWEIAAVTILAPILRDFHLLHPEIRIELDTTDELRDLAAGAADIALRITVRPSGGGLVGRRLADDPWTTYCSRAYAAEHGVPRNREELRRHPLIGGGEPGVWRYYGAFLRSIGCEDAVVMHHNSSVGLLSAVRSGFGIAALPVMIANQEPDLIQCAAPDPEERGYWLLTHERLRHEPRVRAALDFIGARIAALTASGQSMASPA